MPPRAISLIVELNRPANVEEFVLSRRRPAATSCSRSSCCGGGVPLRTCFESFAASVASANESQGEMFLAAVAFASRAYRNQKF